jgi:hypothetical protein
MMTFEAFWSRPPDFGRGREQDPLGLSSLHEAAADVLLPLLSGRTRKAKEYVWVLVGLRWAGEQAATDNEIWANFEIFEKALKLYWFHCGHRRGFNGVDAIKKHYEAGRTDFDFKLISNQRSLGLLGAYLRSLRKAGLVKDRTLSLEENAAHALIDSITFSWRGTISGYGWLDRTFARAEEGFSRKMYKELGRRLFDRDDMRDVAATIKTLGQRPEWRKAAPRLATSNDKQILAGVGNDFAYFSRQATKAFWCVLKSGERSPSDVQPRRLRQLAWREIVFRSATMQGFREPFDKFLSEIGLHPRRALIQLHCEIWKRRGHLVPWIQLNNGKAQIRPDIALKLPPAEVEWDLRWAVAYRLIGETGWRPI